MKNITLLLLLLLTCWLTAQEKPEIFVQMGHPNGFITMKFSPNCKYIISGSSDNTLKLWDITTGKEIRTYLGHSGSVNTVAFTSDSKYIISGSSDKTIKLWEVDTGKEIRTFVGHEREINSIALSPDSKYVVSGSTDKTIKLWDIETGKEIRTFIGHIGEITSVGFSSDGKSVISGSDDCSLRQWSIYSDKELRTISTTHTAGIYSASFSLDGKHIISSSWDGYLKIWNIVTGKELKSFKAFSISPNEKIVTSSSDNYAIKLLNVATGKELKVFHEIKNDSKSPYSIFSPDMNFILSTTYDDGVMHLWDVSTGRELKTFQGHASITKSSSISQNGKYIASCPDNSSISLWDAATGKLLRNFIGHTNSVSSVSFSADSKILISSSWDNTIKLWDLITGNCIKTFLGHAGFVNSSSISPDDSLVVSGSEDNTLKLWQVKSGKEIKTFKGDNEIFKCAEFSPNGKVIISGSASNRNANRGYLKIWDICAGKESKILLGKNNSAHSVDAVAFTPNGNSVASACANNVSLWDITTGNELKTFTLNTEFVTSIEISPDSKFIIVGSSGFGNNTLKLLNISTGKEEKSFIGHLNWVSSASFSPNGKSIISSSFDGTTRRWNIATGEEIAQFISFTDGEWLTITPDGYFDCSPNGAKNINVRVGNSVYSIDNFFETYYRPDIVKARLSGESTDNLNLSNINDGIKTPPNVTISIQSKSGDFRVYDNVAYSDLSVSNGIIKIKVTAKDTGGGVKGVRLFNNCKIAGENIRGIKIVQTGNVYEQEFDVYLTDGENKLKAVGFSDDMTESNPVYATVTYKAAPAGKPDMYILAVGINEYKNSKYNLNYCVDDVQGFVSTITPKAKKIFGNVYTTTVLNQEATKDNLLQKIEEIKAKIKPADVFTLFYAGHGIALDVETDGKTISEFFYVLNGVTQMSSSEKCAENGISGSEMKQLFAQIKAGKQVMFVDACNSGAFAAQFASRGAAEENALAKLSRATGSVIFASTTKEQVATEFKELKHGVFTFVVMEALSGKGSLANGQLTAKSIMSYVEDKIPEYSKKYKGEEQYPTTFMWGQDFPLGVK